jgi:geranylgeranyl diphosphate/geranylgeranyl-bacteriochlorophyllide a reductase
MTPETQMSRSADSQTPPSRGELYDVIVVGGGPSGATAAHDLASAGRSVLLLDKAGRIKPCGGAIPPRLVRDFAIPDDLMVAKIAGARILSPSGREIAMPIDGGYVGMVDRDTFDEWLRDRAAQAGARRVTGSFERLEQQADGTVLVHVSLKDGEAGGAAVFRARLVIGADGALSKVARQALPEVKPPPFVFAYHEIVEAPEPGTAGYDPKRCDVWYQGKLSPDFYGWVFPHGHSASIGTGSAHKGFSLKDGVSDLREAAGLSHCRTIRREGAPIPMKPMKRWDDGRNVVLAGDAAGVVAPASGEGIYYAMLGGRLAAEAVEETLLTGDVRALGLARKRFMKAHGKVFFALGLLQWFWYGSDRRRERFVSMCADPDVQRLTWQSYMNKELVRRDPMAHVRVFMKDVGHLLGLRPALKAEGKSGA